MPNVSGTTAVRSGKTRAKTTRTTKSANVKSKTSTTANKPSIAKKRNLREFWDHMALAWVQAQSAVRQQWHKLTNEDIQEIRGLRENLLKKVEMRYGLMRDEAEDELDKWAEYAEF